MPDSIVADSGPIISLARTNRLHLIPAIYQKIILPSAVYEEIVIKGKNKPGSVEVKAAAWVSIQKPKNEIEVKKLNLINSVQQELDDLNRTGFRITPDLVQEVLKRAGE